jgi:hypothetical protein
MIQHLIGQTLSLAVCVLRSSRSVVNFGFGSLPLLSFVGCFWPFIGVRRKALAECGATTLEIMSITGHRSLAEVERYTREAGRKTLAESGMAKFKPRT